MLGRTTAYILVEETQRVTMMEIASSWHGKNACEGRFLEVKPTLGVDFGDVVARTSHANVPLLGAVLIKNLEKYFSKIKNLKYGTCRYEHVE